LWRGGTFDDGHGAGSRWTVVEHFLYGNRMITIAQRRRSCRTMVLRLATTRPSPVRTMDAGAPIRPRRQTILVEKASTAASLATSRFWVRPRRFGRAGTRAELLRLLMLPDFDRADRIGEFWSYPEPLLRRATDRLRGGSDLGPCWSACCERPVADRMARGLTFEMKGRPVIYLRLSWWRRADSNRRPPACKAGALPAELRPRGSHHRYRLLARRS
jgi:hypothetical protein